MHSKALFGQSIIPYQELPGNYNFSPAWGFVALIIPYQELPGNYNPCGNAVDARGNYTIPRTARELQPGSRWRRSAVDYTIPRTALESSPSSQSNHLFVIINHSVPTINRENHLFPAGRNADERNALFSVFKSEPPKHSPLLDTGRKRA